MALVRIKRRAQDEPIDVLLLACKKLKTEENSVTSVFKFAATVENKEDGVKTHIKEVISNTEPRHSVKFKVNDVASITERLRNENKLFSQNNRLKVVNCFRALDIPGEDQEVEQGKTYTVVDIESSPPTREGSKDSNSLASLTSEQYVYDLYYSTIGDFNDLQMEHLLSAHEVDEKLLFGEYMPDEEEDNQDDEDDSNDENNWRNDYPDEDDDADEGENSSIGEEDMRLAMEMRNFNIDGDSYTSDLSSDCEDEALLYGEDDNKRRHYYCEDYWSESDSDRSDM